MIEKADQFFVLLAHWLVHFFPAGFQHPVIVLLGVVARGHPLMRAHFPRCFVDVNREPYELDPRMFDGRLPSFANTRSGSHAEPLRPQPGRAIRSVSAHR